MCTNNLSQLNLSLSVYLQGNESYPPGFYNSLSGSSPATQLGHSSDDWQQGLWWFHFMGNDIRNSNSNNYKTFWCPSRRLPASPISNNILCANYGINYSICKISMSVLKDEFSGLPLRPEQVHSPFSKLLLMDSGYALISWKALVPDVSVYPFENLNRQDVHYLPGLPSNQNRAINQIQQNDATNGRHHSQKFNAVFADGHVESKKPSSVAPDFDAAGNVSNNSFWSP